MVTPDQKNMFDVLAKQQQHQGQVNRVLKIVLPIVAFLLTVICANMNVWSTVLTFIMLWVTFYITAIKGFSLWYGIIAIFAYTLIDNLLSYTVFNLPGFSRQFGTMAAFVAIFAIGRPYFDRWLMK
ncbi:MULTISPECIES: hypothetical protein [unclassified Acinetobacter]|uniref:hypothetical protein n=1 Tax=unclassified Acinetobacter TaxID=196816 RepID=UPI002934D6BD|nr:MULTISPECIES: hypothetical protein [unclassified Acinetobacter]WOE30693.1 hypothetical protein QSG84_09945 [Acinetobacter sp. SAAs470]WOE38886.1 hypothetical protein QSG86_03610 [Acinetobacter sp. SAAs474]